MHESVLRSLGVCFEIAISWHSPVLVLNEMVLVLDRVSSSTSTAIAEYEYEYEKHRDNAD
jgi:hypothetical protein